MWASNYMAGSRLIAVQLIWLQRFSKTGTKKSSSLLAAVIAASLGPDKIFKGQSLSLVSSHCFCHLLPNAHLGPTPWRPGSQLVIIYSLLGWQLVHQREVIGGCHRKGTLIVYHVAFITTRSFHYMRKTQPRGCILSFILQIRNWGPGGLYNSPTLLHLVWSQSSAFQVSWALKIQRSTFCWWIWIIKAAD